MKWKDCAARCTRCSRQPASRGKTMPDNLEWLWYAFSAAWVLHILYLVSISAREKKLRQQINDLRTLLEEHDTKAAES